MALPVIGIFVAHAFFWAAFSAVRIILRAAEAGSRHGSDATVGASEEHSARYPRLLVAFHALAFGILYFGLANAVLSARTRYLFPSQPLMAICIIGCGVALSIWALIYFRSWRFRATLTVGHELATGGPFRYLRHPIYMALNLLALGSALWAPTLVVWAAFVLLAVGSDLRARAEEALLLKVFGAAYVTYCARTVRFVPALY